MAPRRRRRRFRSRTCSRSASAEKGAQVAKQCGACHNFQEGAGAKVGPDLYGIVGRQVASVAGFNYSTPLKALGGTWTFDALNKWLTKPSADVPGTAMTFAGLSNEKQRADVIAYLNTLSANPLPLPKPARGCRSCSWRSRLPPVRGSLARPQHPANPRPLPNPAAQCRQSTDTRAKGVILPLILTGM